MKLKVCSFNLRYATRSDGDNQYIYRRERIFPAIREQAPDLIGFQEVNDPIRTDLRQSLDGYTLLGCGRTSDYTGESPLLAFRTEDFELIAFESFWLSPTPSIPGSTYGMDQSTCPRVTFAALLKHHDAETPFWFYNTHYDHLGEQSRRQSTEQLLAHIGRHGRPFVLTGDFNATPDSEEIRALTARPQSSVVDATALLGGTFHGYGTCNPPMKIDYIFTNLPCDPTESYAWEDVPENGVYLSDHLPICSFITLD